MAFQTNNVAAFNQSVASNEKPEWKSDRFINISIPTADGTEIKLGAIGLKLNDPNHADLIAWLDADEKNIEVLMKNLIVRYRSAEKKAKGFAFIK
jgi:hypothetical protein